MSDYEQLKEEIVQVVIKYLENLVGDTPVSCQLDTALGYKANNSHTHEDYALQEDFNKLSAEVKKLTELVGDTSVAEQIMAALK